jgi:hypothetical protein
MTFISFVLGASAFALGWFAYDLGRQSGRREMRKLARFGVNLEEWEAEQEPLPSPTLAAAENFRVVTR